MRILFIHCNINSFTAPHFVPGIGSISAVLKQAGHDTNLIFLQEEMGRDEFLAKVREINPGLIAFSTLTNQWPYVRQYTRWLREACDLPMIHGGVHVTVTPEESLQSPEINMICIGEGEFPMRDLMERLVNNRTCDDIPNIWIKKPDGRIIKNPLRPLIQDLDALPIPDRELFNYRQLLEKNPIIATLLMAGRGCPFTCKYCVNHSLQKLYQGLGKFIRRRSQENVLQEIRYLIQNYGLDNLFIYDDTFTYDHRWLKKFCELYRREIKIPFTVNVRLDTVDASILAMLKRAGCEMIVAGIESGNPRVRREIMGRNMSNQKIIQTCKTARKLGLKIQAYYIFGSPTETPQEAEDTLRLHETIKPTIAQVSVFYPFPGTELYHLCKQKGYLTDREYPNFFYSFGMLNHPSLTSEQIAGYVQKLYDSHLRHKIVWYKKGIYDFLFHFPRARVKTEDPDYVKLTTAIIDNEERMVLFAHPESRISYTLKFPSCAKLKFGMGFYPSCWSQEKGTGVTFEILLEEKGKERLLFSQHVDPKNNPSDRKWHDAEISLGKTSPGQKTLHFVTSTQGQGKQYCWSFWSQPALYALKNTPVGRRSKRP